MYSADRHLVFNNTLAFGSSMRDCSRMRMVHERTLRWWKQMQQTQFRNEADTTRQRAFLDHLASDFNRNKLVFVGEAAFFTNRCCWQCQALVSFLIWYAMALQCPDVRIVLGHSADKHQMVLGNCAIHKAGTVVDVDEHRTSKLHLDCHFRMQNMISWKMAKWKGDTEPRERKVKVHSVLQCPNSECHGMIVNRDECSSKHPWSTSGTVPRS
ncbi:hypothetical protein EDD86DRAFT_216662 [Gorgonomyces haynaldii]|nr:hypothetical protein EDD86DRAFT_216662 [Gorgonomyces haynaldii]